MLLCLWRQGKREKERKIVRNFEEKAQRTNLGKFLRMFKIRIFRKGNKECFRKVLRIEIYFQDV
jgi:hypothetical protein